MSFLAPLFLLGGLAVTLPIVFHLIRRRAREPVPFSSLLFLTPSPPRITRRSRLEHLLLLALRCAIIALLTLAFARPFLKQRALAAAALNTRTLLLVDVSASMQRDGLWEQAGSEVIALARSARASDELAMLAFDGTPRSLITFDEWAKTSASDRVTLVSERLRMIRPGWGGTDLGKALAAAANILDEQKQKSVLRRIVLVSDFQEGARITQLQGFTWPKDTSVVAMRLKAKQPTNAGVQWLADEPITLEQGRNRVRVVNSRESKSEQFTVQWTGASNRSARVYVAPGLSRTIEVPPATDRVTLSGDETAFDNTAWHSPEFRQEVTVAFLGNDAERDPHGALFFVRRAFSDSAQKRIRVIQVSTTDSAAELTNSSFIIVAEHPTREQTRVLAEKVRAGTTVLWICRAKEDTDFLSQLTRVQVSIEGGPGSGYAMFGEIDFNHPLFSPFADARFSDFTKIHFWKRQRIGFTPSATARLVAKFDDGTPAIAQFTVEKGNLFLLASGWQPADSQLALSSKFVPLLYSLLETSGAMKLRGVSFEIGQSVDLSFAAAEGSSGMLRIRKPDGRIIALKPGETLFSETDLPGIFSVDSLQPPFQFAVNVPPEESRTAPMDLAELGKAGVPITTDRFSFEQRGIASNSDMTPGHSAGQFAELEARQKLWRWLIAATLGILIVETWAAAHASRRAAIISEDA